MGGPLGGLSSSMSSWQDLCPLRVLTSDQMPHLGDGGGTRALPWPWGKAGGVSDTRMLGTDRGLHLGLCELEGSGRAQPRIDDQGRGPPG